MIKNLSQCVRIIRSSLTVALVILLVIPSSATGLTRSEREGLFTPFYDPESSSCGGGNNEAVDGTGSILSSAEQIGVFEGPQIKPTAIILHWTAGEYDTPQQLINVLKSRVDAKYPNGRAVQLTIDKEGKVYQLSKTLETRPMQTVSDQGWNDVSIGIEIESGSFGNDMTAHENDLLNNEVQFKKVLLVVKELMTKYSIENKVDVSNKKGVFGHFDANAGNSDPGTNYMAKIRNELSSTSASASSISTGSSPVSCVCSAISGSNNAQIAFNYFTSKGLTVEQSAGIVGNFEVEAPGVDPMADQPNGPGRGIAQWSEGGRWDTLLKFASIRNVDPLSLQTQLDFVWFELTGDPTTEGLPGANRRGAYDALIKTTTIVEAVNVFVTLYEGAGIPHTDRRIREAEKAFNAYASSATSGGGGCIGVGGIDRFPLNTTKNAIEAGEGGARWCYKAISNCHHDYNAADIHVAIGTEVLAAKGGKVIRAVETLGSVGSRVVILGDDGQFTYYYTHMTYNSLLVAEGDTVTTGQVIGTVGDSRQAVGTAPHLHFDMLPQSQYKFRPNCSGSGCSGYPFVDVQPLLVQLYETQVGD